MAENTSFPENTGFFHKHPIKGRTKRANRHRAVLKVFEAVEKQRTKLKELQRICDHEPDDVLRSPGLFTKFQCTSCSQQFFNDPHARRVSP